MASASSGSFGARNGQSVRNAASLMADVDSKVGAGQPPAVHMVYAEPVVKTNCANNILNYSYTFGHCSLGLTLASGQQKHFNIYWGNGDASVPGGRRLVKVSHPRDYFFGTSSQAFDDGDRGLYNRSFKSVRIEKVAPEKVEAMAEYLTGVMSRFDRGRVVYSVSPIQTQVFNLLNWCGLSSVESGNCADFVSRALVVGGLLDQPGSLPKSVFVALMRRQYRLCPQNVHVIDWQRIAHAKTDPLLMDYDHCHGGVHGMRYSLEPCVWDLSRFAHVKVFARPGSEYVEAAKIDPQDRVSISSIPSRTYGCLGWSMQPEPHLLCLFWCCTFNYDPRYYAAASVASVCSIFCCGKRWFPFDNICVNLTALPFAALTSGILRIVALVVGLRSGSGSTAMRFARPVLAAAMWHVGFYRRL